MERVLSDAPMDAAVMALAIDPAHATRAATDDLGRWSADARRAISDVDRDRAIRRIQGSVFLSATLLVTQSARYGDSPAMRAYEGSFLEGLKSLTAACRRLPPDARAGCERYQRWSQVARMQYLLNARRFPELERLAKQVDARDEDGNLRLQTLLLEGLAQEAISRSILSASFGSSGLGGQFQTDSGGGHFDNVPVFSPSAPQRRAGARRDASRKAEATFRRVLALAPGHHETRIHFGRALIDLDQTAEAIEVLTPLIEPGCQTAACGLAALMAGEAHERRGALDEAAAAYSRASALMATRQSALLALIGLTLRQGRADVATAMTSQLLVSTPLSSLDLPDAWTLYLGGRRLDVDAVLTPLRQARLP